MHDLNRFRMRIQHFLKLPVYKRTLVRPCAAQLNTEIPNGIHHLCCADLTAAAGAGFPVHFACRLGPAHDSSRSMNGAVVRILVLSAVLPFNDNGNIPHTAADKTNLTGRGWGRPFADDNDFFPVMRLFPSIVMMVMHFKVRFCSQNG
ncbi:hypothetical protein D3C75_545450 [compost metagenome]